ncbi:pogo transposable element with KRAB [Trichonephila clavipes]|nr:pogo transposable element with KRAB [Trichonephila clavipes]
MDEVPLTFDCPPNRTVDTCGVKKVSITTGQERANFTVILACCTDGKELKPLLIFKAKTIPQGKFSSKRRNMSVMKRAEAKKNIGAELSVIPGGLTKILQPLDISVSRSFKSHARAWWEENWMSEGLPTCTKGGNMRRASYTEVAEC